MDQNAPSIRSSATQSGPKARANFSYQDKCAVYVIVERLRTGNMRGVLIEYATDIVILPEQGKPEFVSIKNRESHHSGSPGWTISELRKNDVLLHLYNFWKSANSGASVTVYSPAGLQSKAAHLAASPRTQENSRIVREIVRECKIPEDDIAAFSEDLVWPRSASPNAEHIDDVNLSRIGEFLTEHGKPPAAGAAYDALLRLVEFVSVDRRPVRDNYPTVAARVANAENDLYDLRHLSAEKLLSTILSATNVRLGTIAVDNSELYFESHLVKRTELLDKLGASFFADNDGRQHAVALVGPSGCGKTTLAMMYAASLDWAARVAILDETILHSSQDPFAITVDELSLAAFLDNPRNVVIFDAIGDPENTVPFLGRTTQARVIITSSRSNFDPRIRQIKVSSFDQDESRSYLRNIWPELTAEDATIVVSELDGNPLALTQAAGTARAMEMSPAEYLTALHRAPCQMLSLGAAADHPGTLAATIALSLHHLEYESTDAALLLHMMSAIGPLPIPMEWLESGLICILDGSAYLDPQTASCDPLATDLSNLLNDYPRLIQAFYTLTSWHLVRRIGSRYAIHTAVANVNLATIADFRPLLEVGFGLLARHMPLSVDIKRSPLPAESDASVALRLIGFAEDHGVAGPAVDHASACFAQWVGLHDPETGRKLADRGWAAHQAAVTRGVYDDASCLAGAVTYAEAVAVCGDKEEAFVLLEWTIAQGLALPEVGERLAALLFHVSSQCAALSYDLGEDYLHKAVGLLEQVHEALGDAPETQLSLLLLKLFAALHYGVTVDAVELLKRAKQLADEQQREQYRVARIGAALARFDRRIDGERWAGELATCGRQELSSSPSFAAVALTDAADTMIEAGNLAEARKLVEEARQICAQHGISGAAASQVDGVSGRLHLETATAAAPSDSSILGLAINELSRAAIALHESGADAANLPSVLVNLAQAEFHAGRREPALEHATEAYQIDLARFGEDHPETLVDLQLVRSIQMVQEWSSASGAHAGSDGE